MIQKQFYKKLLLSLLFLLLANSCYGATEFICTINKTGEDYNTPTLWEAAMDDAGDLTDGTVKTGSWDAQVGSDIADATDVGWDAGETGNATSAVANTLTDSGASFTTSGVAAGDLVMNTTDTTTATVTTVDSNTQLTLSADIFDTGDEAYEIYWSYGTLIHMTATQYLIDVLNGTLADNDTVIDISNNSFDVNGTPDSAIITAELYDDDGDLDSFEIDGFTTNETNYVRVYVPAGERHNGTADTGAKVKRTTTADWQSVVSLNDSYCRLEWLEMECDSDYQGGRALYIGADHALIQNCIMWLSDDHDMTSVIFLESNSDYSQISNCIVWGNPEAGDTGGQGMYTTDNSNTTEVDNCTLVNFSDYGVYATFIMKNNLVQDARDNTDYKTGAFAAGSLTNLSSDASGSAGLQNIDIGFVDEANEDYHLASTDTDAIDAGTDLGDSIWDTDIDGQDRDTGGGTWDLGADERGSIESAQTGNWSSASTWNGNVPGAGRTAIIKTGHTVTVDEDVSIGDGTTTSAVTVESGATLNFAAAGYTLTADGDITVGDATNENATATLYVGPGSTIEIASVDSASATMRGIIVKACGYLRVEGNKDDSGTTTSGTNETTIEDTTKSWTADAYNGRVVKFTSGYGEGKIRTITDTTATTLVIADNSVSSTLGSIGGYDYRTYVVATTDCVTVDNEHVSRYMKVTSGALSGNYYRITDTSTNDYLYFVEDLQTLGMTVGDTFTITDGILSGDTYEIYNYATVTAATQDGSHDTYISCEENSETLIKYAEISYMGRSANPYYSITVNTVNNRDSNEGLTVEDSELHHLYYGIYTIYGVENIFANNYMYDCSNYSMYIAYPKRCSVTSCIFNGQKINIQGSGFVEALMFEGNTLYNSSMTGFDSGSTVNYCTFISNTVFNNTSTNATTDGTFNIKDGANLFIENDVCSYGSGFTFYDNNAESPNILISNSVYGCGYAGLRAAVTDADYDIIIAGGDFGSTRDNDDGDIYLVSDEDSHIYLKDVTLDSSTEVGGSGKEGALIISQKHNSTAGLSKIWGDYNISSGTKQFNYADQLYVSYVSTPKSMRGESSMSAVTTSDANTKTEYWKAVYDSGNTNWVVTGTVSGIQTAKATNGVQYTSDGSEVQFTITESSPLDGDIIDFATIAASGDTNTQKTVQFGPFDRPESNYQSSLTVASGATLELKGASANPTLITKETGGSYPYAFIVNGTIDANYYQFDYTNEDGLRINSGATITDMTQGTFNNAITSGAHLTFSSGTRTITSSNLTFDSSGSYDIAAISSANITINSPYTRGNSYDKVDSTSSLTWQGAPNEVTLSKLFDNEKQADTTPAFEFTTTDGGASDLTYQIEWWQANNTEGFEDNDMDGWYTCGDVSWSVSSENAQSGTYSVWSGVTTASTYSVLYREIEGPATLTFYSKLYMIASHNLNFYIDGVLQETITSNEDWTQKSYSIGMGTHTIMWICSGVASSSTYGAWIDVICPVDVESKTTKTSDTDSGFENITTPADTTPFTSGDTVKFTVQAADALTDTKTYWWRVRAKDAGDTEWGEFSNAAYSFTVDTSVTQPTWYQTLKGQFDKDTITSGLDNTLVTRGDTNDVRLGPPEILNDYEYKLDDATDDIYALCMNSSYLFAAGMDSNIRVYSLSDMSLYDTLNAGEEVFSLHVDSNHLIAGCDQGYLRLWDLSDIDGTGNTYTHSFRQTTEDIFGVTSDTNYIYARPGRKCAYVYAQSDLSLYDTLTLDSNYGNAIYVDANYLYVADRKSNNYTSVKIWNLSSITGAGATYDYEIDTGLYYKTVYALEGDSTYLYVGCDSPDLKVYTKSDRSLYDTLSAGSYDKVYGLKSTTDYLFAVVYYYYGGTPTLYEGGLRVWEKTNIDGTGNSYDDSYVPTTVACRAIAADQTKLIAFGSDDDNVYVSKAPSPESGYILSTAIDSSDFSGIEWTNLSFSDVETTGDIKYYVYYDSSGTPTIIPDGDLTGNSSGFDTSPVDLSGLNISTYSTLYVKAILTDVSGGPILQDWTVDGMPNIAPAINTVTASQRSTDGHIDITINMKDENSNSVTYSIEQIAYDGETFGNMTPDEADATHDDEPVTLTSSYADYHYIFDLPADQDNSATKVKIQVNDSADDSNTITSSAFTVDTKAPTGLGSFTVSSTTSTTATLTWDQVTETNFDHYEIWYDDEATITRDPATESEWDNTLDGNLANASAESTTINTGLITGTTYYFEIWAVDDYGNESTVAEINGDTNVVPIGGYEAANVIPAAQCAQQTDGSGDVVISFRIKDTDLDNCTLNTFEYSVDDGLNFNAPTTGDASSALSSYWMTNGTSDGTYSSAADWGGTVHSFTFTTKDGDVSGLDDVDQLDVQIHFTVNDGSEDSANPAESLSFTVDNEDPTLSLEGYYTDSPCTSAFTGTYMKVGTYYIKISASESLGSTPTISIAAEGTANDVTDESTTLLSGNDYVYTRTIAEDAAAVGSTAEVITTSSSDSLGNTTTDADVTGEKYTDTTIPSGGSVSYADGETTSTEVTITLDEGTDVTGIASRMLQRAVADYTNNTAGSFSSFSDLSSIDAEDTSYDDTTLIAGKAYKYQYVVTDNADNDATYTSGNIVKVLGAISKFTLSAPVDITAGTEATYSVTKRDVDDNAVTSGAQTVYLYSDSTGNDAFREVSEGSAVTSVIIADGQSAKTFYYYDDKVGDWTITASDATPTADGDIGIDDDTDSITVNPAAASYFTLTEPADITAGAEATYIVTRYDEYGNLRTSGAQTVYLYSDSTGNDEFRETSEGSGVTSVIIADAQSAKTFYYYDDKVGDWTITASDATPTADGDTGIDDDTDSITVEHADTDHLKFSANIPEVDFKAGTAFELGILHAVDVYGNLCDGAAIYSGTKTIAYSLSGDDDAPNGTAADSYTYSVAFTDGVSTATLTTTLYRAQDTTITANATDLDGTDVASNSITVDDTGIVDQLSFSQQPSTSWLTNVALGQQPIVAVADEYGNTCTGASDQITLTGSTTGDPVYTPVTNGTLSVDVNPVETSNGAATFSGVKYSYPEAIYLRASGSGDYDDKWSYQITFSTASDDGTMTAGDLSEPSTIASTVDTLAEKVDIFDFKITDAGTDGCGLILTEIVITRGATDTTDVGADGWTDYIAAAYITDGTTPTLGAVTDDNLTFGDGATTLYTVANTATNGTPVSTTFTLSIYLEESLPAGADGKTIAFDIDPNDDITVDTVGSGFDTGGSITSSTDVEVTVTKFIVTGSAAAVAAGAESTLYIDATDVNDNIDTDYAGSKQVIFSGANDAGSGDSPTCNGVDFGDATAIGFASGENSTAITMILYKAEGAAIKATCSSIETSDADDHEIVVTGGAASELSWYSQPESTVVANAPWKAFSVSVTDAYENISPESKTITITPSGGTVSADSTSQVAAESGISTFNDFGVYCSGGYPGVVTINATASGVTESGASNAVTVIEKYDVTVKVLDSVTGAALDDITLSVLDEEGVLVSGFENPMSGNSPFSFKLLYGEYRFSFEKEAYVATTIERTADTAADGVDNSYDNDITWSMYLTSVSESLADYRVLSDFVYDEDDDILYANVRLERRGQHITTDETRTLQTCTLNIYEGSAATAMYSDSLAVPDDLGNYWFTIEDAVVSEGFVAGKSYFAKMTVVYGTSGGVTTTYLAATTFDIGVTARLKTWTEEIKSEVAGVKTKVETEATGVKAKVEEETAAAQSAIESKVAATETAVKAKVTATETAIKDKVTLEAASRILNQESYVRANDTLSIRYKTDTGLSPVISVYDADNTKQIDEQEMTETVSDSGIYEYDVQFIWGRGEHTVLCKEETKGTLDAINIEVISTDLEDIATTATTTMAQLQNIDTDQIAMLSSSVEDINSVISSIVNNIDELAQLSSKVRELAEKTSTAIYSELEIAVLKLKEINEGQGIKLEKMYDLSEEQSTDVDYIKNKTLEIRALVELTQDILSRTSDKPIVKSWMESETEGE